MQFGWLTLAHSGSPEGDYGAIQELVEQACFAEAAGFDGIWLTEHNFTGESVYCDPIPFASVVAARTSRSSTTCRAVGSTSAWATGPTSTSTSSWVTDCAATTAGSAWDELWLHAARVDRRVDAPLWREGDSAVPLRLRPGAGGARAPLGDDRVWVQ